MNAAIEFSPRVLLEKISLAPLRQLAAVVLVALYALPRGGAAEVPLAASEFDPVVAEGHGRQAVVGLADGFGWAGGWDLGRRGDAFRIAPDSLGWLGLATSGGRAIGGRGCEAPERRLDLRPNGPFAAWLCRSGIGAPGTTLWLSALMRRERGMPHGAALMLADETGGDWLGIGCFPHRFGAKDGRWGMLMGWSCELSAQPVVVGQAALLVLRLDFGAAATTATLYVDPISLGGAAPAMPSARLVSRHPTAMSRLRWYAGPAPEESSIDEIRIGATYASVTPVRNHPPTFAIGPALRVVEDCGPQTVPRWITGISAGAADESGQHVGFIVSVDHPELFSAPPVVAADGTLGFTPAANANGSVRIRVQARDDGGGDDTSPAQETTIAIAPVNDPPSFVVGGDVQVMDDAGAVALAGWISAISAGPADEAGQTVAFTTTCDRPELFARQPAIAGDGTLTFAPALGADGIARITVVARDDGGTADGGVDVSAPATAAITVQSLPPTITSGPTASLSADGTRVALSATATGSSLVYAWEMTAGPAPATITSAADGTATATLAMAGGHRFSLTISDGRGRSAVGEVAIDVPALPTSVILTPAQARLATGDAMRFVADVRDQFGLAIPLPSIAWAAESGTIDSDGDFVAGAPGGPFRVTATVGAASGEAQVTVLALVDAALGGTASQSSSYPGADDGPEKAIDGNVDGDFSHASVTHTNLQKQPWWEVDLGSSRDLRRIEIWNRTDAAPERLSAYWVLVSDEPFASSDPRIAAAQPGVTAIFCESQAGRPTTLPIVRTARYVRVQLSGTDYLSLAEVVVMAVDDAPRGVGALGRPIGAPLLAVAIGCALGFRRRWLRA